MKIQSVIITCVILFFVFIFIGFALVSVSVGDIIHGNFGGQTVEDTKSSEISKVDIIDIDSRASNVKITTDPNAKTATAHIYGTTSGYPKNIPTLTVEKVGDRLTIKTTAKTRFLLFSFFNKLNLDIVIPESYAGELKCYSSAGSITVNDITSKNDISIKSSASRIIANNLTGKSVSFECSAGKIVIDNIKSDSMNIKSSAGSVEMKDIVSKTIDIRNSAGKTSGEGIIGETEIDSSASSIDISFAKVIGKIDIDSSAGKVEVSVPKDTNADVELHSSAGSVSTNFPITFESNGRRTVKGKLGTGGALISLDSSAGSVELNKN